MRQFSYTLFLIIMTFGLEMPAFAGTSEAMQFSLSSNKSASSSKSGSGWEMAAAGESDSHCAINKYIGGGTFLTLSAKEGAYSLQVENSRDQFDVWKDYPVTLRMDGTQKAMSIRPIKFDTFIVPLSNGEPLIDIFRKAKSFEVGIGERSYSFSEGKMSSIVAKLDKCAGVSKSASASALNDVKPASGAPSTSNDKTKKDTQAPSANAPVPAPAIIDSLPVPMPTPATDAAAAQAATQAAASPVTPPLTVDALPGIPNPTPAANGAQAVAGDLKTPTTPPVSGPVVSGPPITPAPMAMPAPAPAPMPVTPLAPLPEAPKAADAMAAPAPATLPVVPDTVMPMNAPVPTPTATPTPMPTPAVAPMDASVTPIPVPGSASTPAPVPTPATAPVPAPALSEAATSAPEPITPAVVTPTLEPAKAEAPKTDTAKTEPGQSETKAKGKTKAAALKTPKTAEEAMADDKAGRTYKPQETPTPAEKPAKTAKQSKDAPPSVDTINAQKDKFAQSQKDGKPLMAPLTEKELPPVKEAVPVQPEPVAEAAKAPASEPAPVADGATCASSDQYKNLVRKIGLLEMEKEKLRSSVASSDMAPALQKVTQCASESFTIKELQTELDIIKKENADLRRQAEAVKGADNLNEALNELDETVKNGKK